MVEKRPRHLVPHLAGREFQGLSTRGVTTVKDQESTDSVAPRRSKKTVAKEGDTIGTGAVSDTNSMDGAGG